MQNRVWIYIFIVTMFICGIAIADEYEIDHGDVALNQAITDLTSHKTILCLAAHPDDEDGATLSYYRKRFGVRTAILYATRGEGGQNEIGSELYEELGVIRAYETHSAADVYGSEVYNLNKRDFGYSKSAEETFKIWGHDDSLQRLVRIKLTQNAILPTNCTVLTKEADGTMILEPVDAPLDWLKLLPPSSVCTAEIGIALSFLKLTSSPNISRSIP
jgi:hypothetical protein